MSGTHKQCSTAFTKHVTSDKEAGRPRLLFNEGTTMLGVPDRFVTVTQALGSGCPWYQVHVLLSTLPLTCTGADPQLLQQRHPGSS